MINALAFDALFGVSTGGSQPRQKNGIPLCTLGLDRRCV